MKIRAALFLAAALALHAQLPRPVTGPNSFLNLPGADPIPAAVVPPPPPPPPAPAAPAQPAKPAPKPVKTPEDLLRDMPMGTGIYSATLPNAAGLTKANAAFAKNSVGRPVEIQIAVDHIGYTDGPPYRRLVHSNSAPYRHRLEDIFVKVEVPLKAGQQELLAKFRRGAAIPLTGTVGAAEFRPMGKKVILVLTVHDPVVP